MAGLNCGLASRIALPDMAGGMAAFCAIDDRAVEDAVRMLLDDGLACGETGASGVAGSSRCASAGPTTPGSGSAWRRGPPRWRLCTEAPTDPASFARITRGA